MRMTRKKIRNLKKLICLISNRLITLNHVDWQQIDRPALFHQILHHWQRKDKWHYNSLYSESFHLQILTPLPSYQTKRKHHNYIWDASDGILIWHYSRTMKHGKEYRREIFTFSSSQSELLPHTQATCLKPAFQSPGYLSRQFLNPSHTSLKLTLTLLFPMHMTLQPAKEKKKHMKQEVQLWVGWKLE